LATPFATAVAVPCGILPDAADHFEPSSPGFNKSPSASVDLSPHGVRANEQRSHRGALLALLARVFAAERTLLALHALCSQRSASKGQAAGRDFARLLASGLAKGEADLCSFARKTIARARAEAASGEGMGIARANASGIRLAMACD